MAMKSKTLILLGCCVPYAFLSIYEDAMSGSMYMYIVMLICVAALSIISAIKRVPAITYAGIMFSGVISTFFTGIFLKAEEWAYYFKPFTPQTWVIILTLILLFVHFLLSKIMGLFIRKV